MPILLPPAKCKGYVFTRVCHSVHGGGFCLCACWDTTPQEQTPPREQTYPPRAGTHPPGSRHTPPGADSPPPGTEYAGRYGQRAGGTHLLECKLVHFVFAMPFKILEKPTKCADVKINYFHQLTSNFTFTNILKIQIMRKIANRWEYKLGIIAIVANFVCLF